MKKMRAFAAALLLVFLLQLGPAALAAGQYTTPQPEEPIWVEPDLINNIDYNITSLGGVYWENTFYVSPDNIAFFANGQVVLETEEYVAFDLMARRIIIYENGGAVDFLADTQNGANRTFEVPVMKWEGRLFISMLHLYRYLGVEIAFAHEAKEPLHLYINCPYTIYDAMGEYVDMLESSTFSLDEVLKDGLGSEIIKKTAALDTMLIHYDNNFTAIAIGASGAPIDLMADCLLMIVREEGADYVDQINTEAKTLMTRTALGADIDSTIFDLANRAATAAGRTAPLVSDGVGGYLGKTNIIAQAAGIYFDCRSIYNMYEAIPNEQVQLLERTLCRIGPNSSLYQNNPELIKAAVQVQDRVTDTYGNIVYSMERGRDQTISAVVSGVSQNFLTAAFGWPFSAVNAVYSITTAFAETDPVLGEYVGDEIALTQARGCMDIQNMALQLFMSDFSAFMDADLYYNDPEACMKALEQLQSDMLLALKSGMMARVLLSDTVYANDEELAAMEAIMTQVTMLMGKLENATLLLPGYPNELEQVEDVSPGGFLHFGNFSPVVPHSPVGDDLSWLPDLAVTNNGGNYVRYRGYTFYWQIDPGFYSGDATVFANYGVNRDVNNTLVRRDDEGNVTPILSAPGHGGIYIAGGRLYWHYDTRSIGDWGYEIHSCGLDGSDENIVGFGELKGFDSQSGNLVYEGNYDGVYLYNVTNGEERCINEKARFVQLARGNVYYETESTDECIMKIWMSSTAHPENEPQRLVSVWGDPIGAYSDMGYKWFCVDSCVHGDYLYIVHGVYAGTGGIFQGGSVGRVPLDGSGEYQVLEGAPEANSADPVYVEDSIFLYDVEGVTYMNYVLYGRSTDWEYKIVKRNVEEGTAVMGGSTITDRQYSYNAGEVYPTAEGFKMNDPDEGGPVMLLTAEEVEALGFEPYFQTGGERGYTHIGATAVVGDLFYFSLVENIRDDSNDVGWRYSYRLSHRAAYVKNMATGEITKLYEF